MFTDLGMDSHALPPELGLHQLQVARAVHRRSTRNVHGVEEIAQIVSNARYVRSAKCNSPGSRNVYGAHGIVPVHASRKIGVHVTVHAQCKFYHRTPSTPLFWTRSCFSAVNVSELGDKCRTTQCIVL